MSSQCQALTLKRTRCSRKASCGKFCTTHNKNLNILEQNHVNTEYFQIVHMSQIQEIVQTNQKIIHGYRSHTNSIKNLCPLKQNQCRFRNIKGQYICNETTHDEFCENHEKSKTSFINFVNSDMHLIDMFFENAKVLGNVDSFILLEERFRIHSKTLMCYSSEEFVKFSLDELSNKVINKFNDINNFLLENTNFISKYVLWTRSIFQIHETRFATRRQLENLNISKILKNTQKEILFEKIALNMLSEIYLQSNDLSKLSVFTKDINNKILSFLQ
jgi:hypothetical protein